MEKRLIKYISYMAGTDMAVMHTQERDGLRKEMLVQIGFFQHERLIHLIVTVTFALLLMISVLLSYSYPGIFQFLLTGLFLVLLIPYIKHYYILENGIQRLYSFYDKLSE